MATPPLKSDPTTEKRLRDFAQTLSEKDCRRFAAIEAAQRGYGGIAYVAGVLGCSTKTIERGLKELDHLQDDPAAGRVRRPGAGRKKGSSGNCGDIRGGLSQRRSCATLLGAEQVPSNEGRRPAIDRD
jgi:hypothetical protein